MYHPADTAADLTQLGGTDELVGAALHMPLLRRAKPPAGSSSSPDSVISTPPTSTWDPPPALPPSAETEVINRGGIGALRSRALRRCCARASATTAASSSSSASEVPATIVGAVPPHCEKASVCAQARREPCGRGQQACSGWCCLDGLDSHPGSAWPTARHHRRHPVTFGS